MTKPTLLLDGDTVVYKFATGLQKDIDWGNGVETHHADLDQAKRFLDSFVEELSAQFDWAPVVIALSDPKHNWRIDILDTYKANRKEFVRPIIWQGLREYVQVGYKTYLRPGLEGDDICGILATHPTLIPGDKIVVGIDKDLLTIPGRHYNPNTGADTEVCESLADWNHLYQTLVGDRVDNYSGCPKVGPVKAGRLLPPVDVLSSSAGLRNTWHDIVAAFEKHGSTEAAALQQARVARICRHTDYDFKAKEVILWSPPSV